MAEKKFSGAPFGTQTARFDVTGVHPKTKVPGTFTQIPYDKPSTLELNSQPKQLSQPVSKQLRQLDDRLRHIKECLSSASKDMNDIGTMNDGKYKHLIGSTPMMSNRSSLNYASQKSSRRQSANDGNRNSLDGMPQSEDDKQECEEVDYSPRTIPIDWRCWGETELAEYHSDLMLELASVAESTSSISQLINKDDETEALLYLKRIQGKAKKENSHCERKQYCTENVSFNANIFEDKESNTAQVSPVSQEGHKDASNNQSVDSSTELGGEKEDNVHSFSDHEAPAIYVERASEEAAVKNDALMNITSVCSSKGRLSKTVLMEKRKSSSKQNLLNSNPVPTKLPDVRTVRSDIQRVIRLHTSPTDCNEGVSKKTSRKSKPAVTRVSQTLKPKSALKSKAHDNTATPMGECESVSPSPFSVLFGNKTQQLKDGEKTTGSVGSSDVRLSLRHKLQGVYAQSCETLLRRKLGPGAYNTIVGGFSTKSVEGRAAGPGWSRQLEVERLASLPHLLYKEQWEESRMLKRKLGPGSYEIKDFIQLSNEKPRSGRGICDKLAPRFEKGQLSATPGPGTYGVGGVPQRALEEKANESTSTKGMLDKGDRKRTLPSVGSHLGPGTYRHKTCTDELLNKVTSLKGPYKLYSGDRNKPITEGYLAAPQLADLGPGQYEIGSFVDELGNKERRTHGKFGKMAQYPEVPTDRLFLFSQAHCNRRDVPGPGAYSVQELSKPGAINSPGFLSSAKRDDKMSQKFFTRNFNPVGAGRYDVQKFDEAQDVNGHNSVFRSKTGKPNLQMAKFLQERIRSKDVSVENRVVLNQPGRITRSITVM